MAQHSTDFGSSTLGAIPSGWTRRYQTSGGGFSVVSDPSGSISGRCLEITQPTDGYSRGLSFDASSADAGRDNAEILIRYRLVSGAIGDGVFTAYSRGSGSSTSGGEGYWAAHSGVAPSIAAINRAAGIGSTVLDSDPLAHAVGTVRWMRSRINGSVFQVRYWVDGETEPSTWQVSGTDASPLAGGGVARLGIIVGPRNSTGTCVWRVDWFSDGTNGDAAPSPTPSGPTAPTTAPTIGAITPTTTGASVAFTGFPAGATALQYRLDGGTWTAAGSTSSPLVLTGLTANTEYDIELRGTNSGGNGPASSVAVFETLPEDVEPVRGVQIALYNASTPRTSVTGIAAKWWDSETPTGAPVYEGTVATDSGGVLTIDIDAVTSLALGGVGTLWLRKSGATPADDLWFSGRVTVVDIA